MSSSIAILRSCRRSTRTRTSRMSRSPSRSRPFASSSAQATPSSSPPPNTPMVFPGPLKNALDWLVASETFAGKRVALINASPRAFHAQADLREILSTMAARLMPEAFATLPLTGKTVTAAEVLADATCVRRLEVAGGAGWSAAGGVRRFRRRLHRLIRRWSGRHEAGGGRFDVRLDCQPLQARTE